MHLISKTQQVFVKYMEHISNPVTRREAELVAVSGVQDGLFALCLRSFCQKFMEENLPSKYEINLAGD